MKSTKLLAILNVLAFISTIVVNALANALPINGKNTGELSDMYPNLFVPAGLTFSIWGLIYAAMLLFIAYQFILAFRQTQHNLVIRNIGPWFIVSSIANCAWILAWHYIFPVVSLMIMLILLFSLIKIHLALYRIRSTFSTTSQLLVYPFFSIYLAWITVATIANFTTVFVEWGWNGGAIGPSVWTIIMISVAIGMGIYFAIFRKDAPYTLVIMWALYGIYLKRSQDILPEKGILFVSQFGIYVCAFSVLFLLIRKWSISRQ